MKKVSHEMGKIFAIHYLADELYPEYMEFPTTSDKKKKHISPFTK